MDSKRKLRPLLLPALSLTLLLSACGGSGNNTSLPQVTPPVATTPGKSAKALGMYELQINNLRAEGGAKATAQVLRPGAGGLSAQASEIGGLSYENTSTVTLADAANKVLHITATFKVTNNSGADISVPTFVPVDTAGSYATDGETPFRNITNAKGAPIAPPAGMKVERAYQNSGSVIQPDPSATPLQDSLDTAGLTLDVPAGTTVPGISRRAWQTATLPSGASQEVNFAISVPLQGTDVTDADPFRFSLIFAVTDNPGKVSLTNIGDVQGSTPAGDAASPKVGQSVTVEGVVTSFLPDLGGYFVQETGINADQDSNTSNGVYIYCATTCPALSSGDVVRVTGVVSDFKGTKGTDPTGVTEITSSAATKLASGAPLPAAVSLTLPLDTAKLERYEGMRLSFPETLTVTNNYAYGRYGQLDLSNAGRRFIGTNGNGTTTAQSFITLDDGQTVQNPLNLPYLSAQNTRRTGDTVTGLTGIWHTVAGLPMLEPAGTVTFTDANPRLATPKDVGGTLRVGGANVLNYFTDLNPSYSASGPRGANSAAELKRQRDKMANTLTTLNADVLTLMEVQNNGDTALNDIVAALNEKAGAGTYAAVSTGTVGTDAIKVAIIYKPGKVVPVGSAVIDTNSVYSRPPVAQTFWDKTTGGKFTVIANHLKSKGSCGASDPDTGQGCWNNLRVQQAQQLLNFVGSLKASTGDSDVILMGDFNAYGDEDPIKAIVAGGFESLNKRIPAEDRYSYQFGGLFGYLDHALASQSLSAQVTGITEWHVNSDEPISADYNTEFKAIPECVPGAGGSANTCQGKELYDPSTPFRASDHDPVLVGLNLTKDSDTAPTTQPTAALSASPSVLTVTAGDAAQSSTLTLSTQNYAGGNFTVTSNGAGLSVTPSASSVAPNGTFTVSVSAPAGTAAGTYPVTVTTTGEGGLATSTTVNVTVSAVVTPPPATGLNHLLISQVYGGGGNSGATYTHDFIELFNPTANDISLSGYSVEYFSKSGGSGGKTTLSGTIKAGGYFLIQEASNAAVGAPLPTPNATGTLAMSGTDGSVALANGTTVVDLVGYGTTVKFEGAATAALSATKAAIRTNVCADGDNNKADFTVTTPAPRSTSTAPAVCVYTTN